MMTAAPARAPTPRLKAPATSSTTAESASAFNATRPAPPPPPPRPAAPGRAPRGAGRSGQSDPLSDKATAFLIRRALCPQADKGRSTPAAIHELLPPFTSRNDVDLQLYAFIAIIMREFVQNWYNKITPDETFVADIVQIIAHCTRALEQRLRKVDLESLLFDELPELLDRHVQAYRAAHNPMVRPPIAVDPREVYHSLCPLPSLSPVPKPDAPQTVTEQADNETAYRQLLVGGVLAVLLPTEDLENECLTALVGQIFSELIIGGVVARKAAEPWVIWEGLIILARVIRQKVTTAEPAAEREGKGEAEGDSRAPAGSTLSTAHQRRGRSSWLHRLGWVVVHLAFAAFASLRFLVATIAMSRSLPSRRRIASRGDQSSRHREPGRDFLVDKEKGVSTPHEHDHDHDDGQLQDASPLVPVVAFKIWSTISNLLEMEVRMPWLCGSLSMVQWLAMTGPGQVAGLDGVLDRLVSHSVRTHLLAPSQLPPLLRSLRAALFPNNTPGSPTLAPPASDRELRALRRRAASALWSLAPPALGRVLFAPSAPQRQQHQHQQGAGQKVVGPLAQGGAGLLLGGQQGARPTTPRSGPAAHAHARGGGGRPASLARRPPTARASDGGRNSGGTMEGEEGNGGEGEGQGQEDGDEADEEEARILSEIETGVLDVFADAYCNKHLMYGALELVLVRLMPELAEKGVAELWEERLS